MKRSLCAIAAVTAMIISMSVSAQIWKPPTADFVYHKVRWLNTLTNTIVQTDQRTTWDYRSSSSPECGVKSDCATWYFEVTRPSAYAVVYQRQGKVHNSGSVAIPEDEYTPTWRINQQKAVPVCLENLPNGLPIAFTKSGRDYNSVLYQKTDCFNDADAWAYPGRATKDLRWEMMFRYINLTDEYAERYLALDF